MNASRPAICWRDQTGPPRRPIRKGWTNVKDFLAPSLGLGTCSFLRRGIAQQHLRPWVYLRGISEVGIPALVPFRDRIAGTDDRRSADARTDAVVGLGARLHRDVGGARDRHPPRRIRARGPAAYRGDAINSRRMDSLGDMSLLDPKGRTFGKQLSPGCWRKRGYARCVAPSRFS